MPGLHLWLSRSLEPTYSAIYYSFIHSFNEAVFYTTYQTWCVGLTVQHRGAARLWEKQCMNRPAKPGYRTVTGSPDCVSPKQASNQPEGRGGFQELASHQLHGMSCMALATHLPQLGLLPILLQNVCSSPPRQADPPSPLQITSTLRVSVFLIYKCLLDKYLYNRCYPLHSSPTLC